MASADAAATSGHKGRAAFLVPAWLREYRSDWLRFDITAGLTAAAVVIPTAMAYAAIAGLPFSMLQFSVSALQPLFK